MSATQTHSRCEWYCWPPVKMFGVGNPNSERREPSVPPRTSERAGSSPARRTASSASSTVLLHVAVLAADLHVCAADLLRCLPHELGVALELFLVEIAQDHPHLDVLGIAFDARGMDEAVAFVGSLR
jgi:hypothetical protein